MAAPAAAATDARADADAVGGVARQEQVGGAEEGGDEARGGRAYSSCGRAHLQQPPEIHDADAVGQGEGLFLVMGDQDGGDAELALHLADGAAQLLADLGVERAEGLIEQQHLGLVRQRARHRDALLLAAGQLRRQPVVHALQRHQPQQLLAPLRGARLPRMRRTRSANSMFSATVMWRNSA